MKKWISSFVAMMMLLVCTSLSFAASADNTKLKADLTQVRQALMSLINMDYVVDGKVDVAKRKTMLDNIDKFTADINKLAASNPDFDKYWKMFVATRTKDLIPNYMTDAATKTPGMTKAEGIAKGVQADRMKEMYKALNK